MTYLDLINRFWEMDEQWQFTCCETRLYFYLVKTANRLGWVDNWTHSDAKVAANVGVSPNVLKTARNRLIQVGLIDFKGGGKFRGDKNRYQILTPKSTPNQYPKSTPKQHPYPHPKSTPLIRDRLDKDINTSLSPNGDIPPSGGEGDIPKNETGHVVENPELEVTTNPTSETKRKKVAPKKEKDQQTLNAVLSAYHTSCTRLPTVAKITPQRRTAILGRTQDYGLEVVLSVLDRVSKSDFLNGGNGRGWSASFDWIFKPTNFVKILENNYKNKQDNGSSTDNRAIIATTTQPTKSDRHTEFAQHIAAKLAKSTR